MGHARVGVKNHLCRMRQSCEMCPKVVVQARVAGCKTDVFGKSTVRARPGCVHIVTGVCHVLVVHPSQ